MFNIFRKISRKKLITQFILNIIRQFIPSKILPARHTMLFQRRHDVVRCLKTTHRRWNDVVFLQGLILSSENIFFPQKKLYTTLWTSFVYGKRSSASRRTPTMRRQVTFIKRTGIHFINLGRMNNWFNLRADLRGFEQETFRLVFQQCNC